VAWHVPQTGFSAVRGQLQTTGAMMTAVTGLARFALAEDKSFATVPLTCYVLGSAVTTIPASLLMKSTDRKINLLFSRARPIVVVVGRLAQACRQHVAASLAGSQSG
jgi:hypothetical protein